MPDGIRVFDRHIVRLHRERAAAALAEHDFLLRECADRLSDRLLDVTRRFDRALVLGCHGGELAPLLQERAGLGQIVQADLSPAMARAAQASNGWFSLAADEEFLPFADQSFDLVISNLSLHWVNDLPGALIQARRALRPDGLFLASLWGGETLHELRAALMEAELDTLGGASPRVSPFTDVRDAGSLLQRAGFALPVVDSETITVTYESIFKLMNDLRGMGETNAVAEQQRGFTPRELVLRAGMLYAERHAQADGRLPATFQILTLTGWAPHESQQMPLRPSSAARRLADALGTDERSAGEKALPRAKRG
ncbi:MAG: methyltransferase domain-containing protein [Alphaproteobacteria bacterium]|nr:methyltransferase domain-containing protein [Alphaproteobacteria bacterium]